MMIMVMTMSEQLPEKSMLKSGLVTLYRLECGLRYVQLSSSSGVRVDAQVHVLVSWYSW